MGGQERRRVVEAQEEAEEAHGFERQSEEDSIILSHDLNAVEIGWPFRLGLEGCIVDRSQEIGWQRTLGHGRKIVPQLLQRRGADDDAIIAFGV